MRSDRVDAIDHRHLAQWMDRWQPKVRVCSRGALPWTEARIREAIGQFSLPDASGEVASDRIERTLALVRKHGVVGPIQNGEAKVRTRRPNSSPAYWSIGSQLHSIPSDEPEVWSQARHPLGRVRLALDDRLRWISTTAINLRPRQRDEMRWFLEQAMRAAEFVRADYAFGTTDPALYYLAREIDPLQYAWPVMVIGGEMAAALGQDRIVDSPAAYAQQLPHGAWWIEVAEEPFLVTQPALDSFAQHLGLKPSIAPVEAEPPMDSTESRTLPFRDP